MPPTTHAKLGASASHRWMNCAGSINLSEGIEDTGSVFAIEGTAAHEVGERCLKHDTDAIAYLDTIVVVEENDTEHHIYVTEEMCEAVQVYVDHVRARMAEMGDGVQLFIEHRFNLERLNPPGPMYGTSDATLWHEGTRHLDVNDYKHGAGVTVDATENSQLMMYALGAVVELGKRPDTIRVTITQPRGHHPDGIIRSYDFTFEELIAFKEELFEAARATEEPDAPLAAGDWCRFCPAHAVCPAKKELANEVAAGVFDVVPFTGESPDVLTDEEVALLPSPHVLTDEEVAHILRYAGTIMDWLRAVEAHVQRKLERGEEVDGWKLVEGRANRRWKDPAATEKYLRGRGLKKDERHTLKLLSPAQAEKALKPLDGPPLPERLWEKPEGKMKMVPSGDKRPAIERGAHTAFGIVPEQHDNTENTENE